MLLCVCVRARCWVTRRGPCEAWGIFDLKEADNVRVANAREDADFVHGVLDLALRHLADVHTLQRVDFTIRFALDLLRGEQKGNPFRAFCVRPDLPGRDIWNQCFEYGSRNSPQDFENEVSNLILYNVNLFPSSELVEGESKRGQMMRDCHGP